jgi:transposase
VDLIGPTRPDYRWQPRASAVFAASHFAIDLDRQQITCPERRTSVSWSSAVDRGHNEVVKIKSSAKGLGACTTRDRCTAAKRGGIPVPPRGQ